MDLEMTPVGRKRDFIGEPEPLAVQVLPDSGDEDMAEPALAEVEWRQSQWPWPSTANA